MASYLCTLLICFDVQRSLEVSHSLQDLYEDKDGYIVLVYIVVIGTLENFFEKALYKYQF